MARSVTMRVLEPGKGEQIVRAFLDGATIADLVRDSGERRWVVEDVLRMALVGAREALPVQPGDRR